jgi:hypothetical protein
MQRLAPSMSALSVSKLCCPVCSYLLALLRKLPLDFVIRGDHSTLYPVELPPWLPDNIITQMLNKFEDILVKQILSRMNSLACPQKRRARALSIESQNVSDSNGDGHRSSFGSLYSEDEENNDLN